MRAVSSAWRCEFAKLPIKYQLDYALTRHKKIVALAEIKCRRYSSSSIRSLGGYMLSAHKWVAAQSLSQHCGVPFLIILRLTDGIFFAKPNKPSGLILGGRTDRGDLDDVEPCVLIDMDKFKPLDTA